MAVLFGFEQLIINTEEAKDQKKDDVIMLDTSRLVDGSEEYVKQQIMKLAGVSGTTSGYILQALMAA